MCCTEQQNFASTGNEQPVLSTLSTSLMKLSKFRLMQEQFHCDTSNQATEKNMLLLDGCKPCILLLYMKLKQNLLQELKALF